MACVHQFGIIDNLDDYKEDEFEPEKYKCISVDCDVIDDIYFKGFGDKMKNLDTFAHNVNHPYKDLAYYGITLIPPSSLKEFRNILFSERCEELTKLIHKVSCAIDENKWMIHYGI